MDEGVQTACKGSVYLIGSPNVFHLQYGWRKLVKRVEKQNVGPSRGLEPRSFCPTERDKNRWAGPCCRRAPRGAPLKRKPIDGGRGIGAAEKKIGDGGRREITPRERSRMSLARKQAPPRRRLEAVAERLPEREPPVTVGRKQTEKKESRKRGREWSLISTLK